MRPTKALTDDENVALFHEVQSMMHEGDEDEDRRELSSDEEGYVDGLIDGQTARAAHTGSAAALLTTSAARKESVAVAAGLGFQARQAALFAAFDGLPSATTSALPLLDGGQPIGPAFSEQCRGHSLTEPRPNASADTDMDDADETSGGAGPSGSDSAGKRGRRPNEPDARDAEEDAGLEIGDEEPEDDIDEEDIRGEEDAEDEDPREWSRHTASWAAELTDSADESDTFEPSIARKKTTVPAPSAGSGGSGSASASSAPHSGIATFGGLGDLHELDDAMDDDGASMSSAARKRGAADENTRTGSSGPGLAASAVLPAAAADSVTKRVRFDAGAEGGALAGSAAADDPVLAAMLRRQQPAADERQGGASCSGGAAAGATVRAPPRAKGRDGYVHYSLDGVDHQLDSERANAAGLAQLMQVLGAGGSGGGGTDAAAPRPPVSHAVGRAGGRMMAECVAGGGGGGGAGGKAAQKRSKVAGKSVGGQAKVALSHLAEDDDEEEDVAMKRPKSKGRAPRSRLDEME